VPKALWNWGVTRSVQERLGGDPLAHGEGPSAIPRSDLAGEYMPLSGHTL
jgi:hypothetical protein